MTQTTAKPAWYNRIGLIWQIVIGMIIGVLIGQFLPAAAPTIGILGSHCLWVHSKRLRRFWCLFW